MTQEAPELRILDDDLWQAVKARQVENWIERDERRQADVAAINARRRPRYLFSGLTKMRLLRRRLLGDLDDPDRLRHSSQQGHLQQPCEHPAR